MERQINSLLYERLLMSNDKKMCRFPVGAFFDRLGLDIKEKKYIFAELNLLIHIEWKL